MNRGQFCCAEDFVAWCHYYGGEEFHKHCDPQGPVLAFDILNSRLYWAVGKGPSDWRRAREILPPEPGFNFHFHGDDRSKVIVNYATFRREVSNGNTEFRSQKANCDHLERRGHSG